MSDFRLFIKRAHLLLSFVTRPFETWLQIRSGIQIRRALHAIAQNITFEFKFSSPVRKHIVGNLWGRNENLGEESSMMRNNLENLVLVFVL
jgi:hypothetical protein